MTFSLLCGSLMWTAYFFHIGLDEFMQILLASGGKPTLIPNAGIEAIARIFSITATSLPLLAIGGFGFPALQNSNNPFLALLPIIFCVALLARIFFFGNMELPPREELRSTYFTKGCIYLLDHLNPSSDDKLDVENKERLPHDSN